MHARLRHLVTGQYSCTGSNGTISVAFVRAEKALSSLHICIGSREPSSRYRIPMFWLKWRFVFHLCDQSRHWRVSTSNRNKCVQQSVRCCINALCSNIRCFTFTSGVIWIFSDYKFENIGAYYVCTDKLSKQENYHGGVHYSKIWL